MAAMLHDVIEDTGISKAAGKSQFGDATLRNWSTASAS
jgi:(p)ppGpp synthase/HD superfamily hydrolase